MREVVIKLTGQKDLIKHQSSAMTFGDLKKELKQVKWSGMRVVERSTKATLQLPDAVLPQGDFILFLVPEKVKSGMVKTSGGMSRIGNINTANYNELRSHMSWLNRNKAANFDMSGGTEDLRKRLLKYKGQAAKPVAKKTTAKVKAKPTTKKAEAPAKKEKKGLFQKKKQPVPVPETPVDVLESCRENINQTIDKLVQEALSGGSGVQSVALQYSVKDLDKEVEKIRSALKGGGYKQVV